MQSWKASKISNYFQERGIEFLTARQYHLQNEMLSLNIVMTLQDAPREKQNQ